MRNRQVGMTSSQRKRHAVQIRLCAWRSGVAWSERGAQGGPRIVDEISVCLMHAMLHCNLVVTIGRRRRAPGVDKGRPKARALESLRHVRIQDIQDLDDNRRHPSQQRCRGANRRTNDARPHMADPEQPQVQPRCLDPRVTPHPLGDSAVCGRPAPRPCDGLWKMWSSQMGDMAAH